MTKPRDPEALLSAYLAGGMEVLPDRVVDAVLDEVHRTRRRTGFGPWMTRPMFKPLLAAAAVVAALISGAVLVTQPSQPAIGGPSPTPTMHPIESQQALVVPTATPNPPTPLVWTQASLNEDWPGPVRVESGGGPILVPILVKEDVPGEYLDPSGDTESAVFPWVDIREVRLSTAPYLYIQPVSSPPRVDPTEQWIAYGVVFDEDRDGVPDWRYGMDNRPVTKDDNQGIRAWRTDLHTGRTETEPPYYNGVAGVVLDTYWDYNDMGATFVFGGDVTGGATAGKRMDVPFYVWASVIQDGRVIATDHAPDAGWLDPGSGPQVERSPDPTP